MSAPEFNGSPTFCLYPFTHMDVRLRGRYGTCCRSRIDSRMATMNDNEPWNGEDFRRIRRELWNGQKPRECQTCWDMEDAGAFSYRQETLMPQSLNRDWLYKMKDFEPETGRISPGIPLVEINFSNVCNLQCRMCNPEFSSRWESDWARRPEMKEWFVKEGVMDAAYEFPAYDQKKLTADVLQYLKTHVSELRHLRIVGGEPLLHPEHYDLLEFLQPYAHNIVLEYSSNMSVTGLGSRKVFDFWEKFKQVHLIVSIDGPPGLYEYIRRGARSDQLEKNVRTLQNFILEKKLQSKFVLRGSCTFTAYNVGRALETALYIAGLGLQFHSSQVESPAFLSSQVLPSDIKDRIAQVVDARLAQIEGELENVWAKNSIWQNSNQRHEQIYRVRTYVGNAIRHMHAQDLSEQFPRFLGFDRVFNGEMEKRTVGDFYPEWHVQTSPVSKWQRVKAMFLNPRKVQEIT